VAVIQLSKIQHRRGQKNTGSGLPQLASAELGWAIDTRELYIGNGAVSEGAPAVGNTKILTEYDDLFSLANTYSYRSPDSFLTGSNPSAPVERTLQERLDDTVSVRAFGATGDGVKDDTAALQRAIDQIYLSSSKGNPSSRIQLQFEAGTYRITDTLYVPPHATLIGAGSDKSVLQLDTDTAKPVIKTVNDSSTPGNHAGIESSTFINQPRNITIHGFTLTQSTNETGLLLEACRDSVFEDIKIEGIWTLNDLPDIQDGAPAIEESAIRLEALSGAVLSDSNSFINCVLRNFSWGVRSEWDVKYNTFNVCEFSNLGYGIGLGLEIDINDDENSGKNTGPRRNTVTVSRFIDIARQGIWIGAGEKNVSENNSFTSVGNENGSETSPLFPVILFETYSNVTENDWFSRTGSLLIANTATRQVPYVPEIEGAAWYHLAYEQEVDFGPFTDTRIFRLPGYQNQTYELDYTITSESYLYVRSGIMQITMLDTPSGTAEIENRVEITDDFSFVGNETYLDSIEFSASLQDLGDYQDTGSSVDTVAIRVNSSMPNDETSIMRFTIRAKKTRIG
jgi:hypothetical protein